MIKRILFVILLVLTVSSCSTVPYTEISGEENKTVVSQEMGDVLYVANKNSFTYHLPKCYLADRIKDENKLETYDLEMLQRDGFKPCKICQK